MKHVLKMPFNVMSRKYRNEVHDQVTDTVFVIENIENIFYFRPRYSDEKIRILTGSTWVYETMPKLYKILSLYRKII